MDKILRIDEAKDFCSNFRKEFHDKFGVQVYLYFSQKGLKTPSLDLEILEEIINGFIFERFDDMYPDGVRQRTRQRDLMVYRQILFYIAKSMGYQDTLIGRFYGWNHASIWHSINVVDNYLDSKDKRFLTIYKTIKDAFEERLRNGGNVQSISEP